MFTDVIAFGSGAFFAAPAWFAQAAVEPSVTGSGSEGATAPPYPVHLYMFYRADCPHCHEMLPLIDSLSSQYPTLILHKYEISQNTDNYALFQTFLKVYDLQLETVPSIFIGKQAFQGSKDQTWEQIQNKVSASVRSGASGSGDEITGNVEPIYQSTPTSTPETGSTTATGSPTPSGEVHHHKQRSTSSSALYYHSSY